MEKIQSFPGGFAVLMAVYRKDSPSLFEKAVNSVFMNSLKPNQFIIVIDGPIEGPLRSMAEKLRSKFSLIQFIQLPLNVGLANALNEGIKYVDQNWIVRADADDINLHNRFEKLAHTISQNPNIQLLGSTILEIDQSGHPLSIREVPCSEREIRRYIKRRNPFNHMTVAYKADAVRSCGGYPNIFLKEDYGLWILMLHQGIPMMNLSDILVHASAGMDMFRRRGGWQYAKSEWKIQSLLVRCGNKSFISSLVDGFMRATFFLIPSGLRGILYMKALRKSV